jgi:hypothetical protein
MGAMDLKPIGKGKSGLFFREIEFKLAQGEARAVSGPFSF